MKKFTFENMKMRITNNGLNKQVKIIKTKYDSKKIIRNKTNAEVKNSR